MPALRHCREPRFDLAARPPLLQYDLAASIEADDVERILANIDAHRGNGRIGLFGHGCASLIASPSQHHAQEGQGHGRTIPLADLSVVHPQPSGNLSITQMARRQPPRPGVQRHHPRGP